MLKVHQFFLFVSMSMIIMACSSHDKSNNSITIFAAASVTGVMSEIANDFKKETGINVRLNFASSGILARQIESGADFDYYVSASKEWMNYLDTLHLVDQNSINNIAGNSLVAIVPMENKELQIDSVSISNFPRLFQGRISIGDPAHVPAGRYAQQIITKHAWENDFAKRILPAKNVRDALFMVEMGEVEMGLVYSSDAQKSQKVRVVYEFSLADCDPIQYYSAGKVKSDKKLAAFINFLNGDKAKSIWTKNGFKIE